MTSHVRHRRLSDPAAGFPPTIEPGEIAVNTSNRQIAVGDAATASPGVPLPFLAVRVFDARAQYVVGDFIIEAGELYRANVDVAPGAFSVADWDVYATDVALKAYVDAGDAAVTTAYQAADVTLTTAVNGKVARSGDTMTGFLYLYSAPQDGLHAATKDYVDEQVATGGLASLPASSITVAPHGTISSTDAQSAIIELDTEKAPLYSPTLQGIPTTPTPQTTDNSLQIANTSWVLNLTANYVVNYVGNYYAGQASAAQPLMDGAVSVGTSLKFSREDHRHPVDTSRAPINNAALTGAPTAPTPATSSNSQAIATTAFVLSKVGSFAPIDSPVLTGDPQAPTPVAGDNDTSIATTAFVASAVATAIGGGALTGPVVQYVFASGTITIPAGAHSLEVILQGGGGGGNSLGAPAGGGAGATLFKLLTGLTPGNTLTLTVGVGGINTAGLPVSGTATTLASGTQAITTLTAGGGAGGSASGGAGGTAANGDLNIKGQGGVTLTNDNIGGSCMFGYGGANGADVGGYGAGTTKQTGAGGAGLAIFRWYA